MVDSNLINIMEHQNVTSGKNQKVFNVHIGKFMVHLVQKYIFILVGKSNPICFQCNRNFKKTPRVFYEKLYAFEILGDYGKPIRIKIKSIFPKKLLHSSNKTTQLVWMIIVAPIYLVSKFWMTSPISKKKSLDNCCLVERITTIGYYFFV